MYLNESTSGFLSFSLITYKVSIYQWHSFHNGICNKLTLTLEPLFLQCLYDHPVYVTRYCCHHSRRCWKFKEWSSYSPGRFSFNRLYNVLLHLGLIYNVKPKALMTDQYANFKICFPSMFFFISTCEIHNIHCTI